jgi:hypothetical protein
MVDKIIRFNESVADLLKAEKPIIIREGIINSVVAQARSFKLVLTITFDHNDLNSGEDYFLVTYNDKILRQTTVT